MTIASFSSQIIQRKKKAVFYIIIVALLLNYITLKKNSLDTLTHTYASDDGRPIMHTFFEKTDKGEENLVDAWKEEWSLAGFEARVLTLTDAKRHPSFTDMEYILKANSEYIDSYNEMCMYRWLAMAASGGGWMSDYDTFPTNFPISKATNLPNNGHFISFQKHVPSLVSGTAEEWTRVAMLLMKTIPRVESPPARTKSDMQALMIINKEGIHNVTFLKSRSLIKKGFLYKEALSHDLPREVDCETMAEGIALHLSHKATKDSYLKGMFPILNMTWEMAVMHRGKAARIFMEDWRHQCGGSNVK